MTIYAIADLHGWLPDIEECDLLLIAGDICNRFVHRDVDRQHTFFNVHFRNWIEQRVKAKQVLITAGNHDVILQHKFWDVVNFHIPRCKFLVDDYAEVWDGDTKFKVWGYPWQRYNGDWAYNADDALRKEKAALIPADTDIILAHCPPLGIFDTGKHAQNIGCQFLLERIQQIKPKLVVFGHSHYHGHEEKEIDGVHYVNACIVDKHYQKVYDPVRIDL